MRQHQHRLIEIARALAVALVIDLPGHWPFATLAGPELHALLPTRPGRWTVGTCTGRPRPRRISRPGLLLEPQRSASTSAADSRVLAATPFNAAGVALIEDAEFAPYLPGPPLESVVVGFQATSISAKPQ